MGNCTLAIGGEGDGSGMGASVGVAAESDSTDSVDVALLSPLWFVTSLVDASRSGGRGTGGGEGGAASGIKVMLMRL